MHEEFRGQLYKWVNYGKGYRPRFFVLHRSDSDDAEGVLKYYHSTKEVSDDQLRGSMRLSEVDIQTSGKRRLNLVCGDDIWYLKSKTDEDRESWLKHLEGSQKRALRAQRSGGVVARGPKREAAEPPSAPGGTAAASRRRSRGSSKTDDSDADADDGASESDDEPEGLVNGTLKTMARKRMLTLVVIALLLTTAAGLVVADRPAIEGATLFAGGFLAYVAVVAFALRGKSKRG